MPLKIKVPTVREFVLSKSDTVYGVEGEPTRISIRQATQASHERRSNLFSNIIRELSNSDEAVRLIQRFSLEELKRIEVFLRFSMFIVEKIDTSWGEVQTVNWFTIFELYSGYFWRRIRWKIQHSGVSIKEVAYHFVNSGGYA